VPTVTSSSGASSGAQSTESISARVPQIFQNAANGNVAEQIASQGLKDVYGSENVKGTTGFWTPYGWRFVDNYIIREGLPNLIVEVKSGGAVYGGEQALKDAWLVNESELPLELLVITILL
jgi:hypothetical protein